MHPISAPPTVTKETAVSNGNRWTHRINNVDFAFQPIVSIHSGQCFGYECLLRGFEKAGFDSISGFFDAAHRDGVLHDVERKLSEKALCKFKRIPHFVSRRLFINVDSRCLLEVDRFLGSLDRQLTRMRYPSAGVYLEISEQHPLLACKKGAPSVLSELRKSELKIALDDFGTGFSGFQALYHAEPDIIKIDRFFISDIARNPKKKIFVTSMVSVAHLLGAMVIAEGIETKTEFFACLGIGCDFIQGYFVQEPQVDIAQLRGQYRIVERTARRDRRRARGDQRLICSQIEPLPHAMADSTIADVLDQFREHRECSFFPVMNSRQEPVGIIREDALKDFIYAEHGHHQLHRRNIRPFVSKCPIADINLETDRILEAFSMDDSAEGVLIVKDLQYLGFLSARSLLKIIHEKNLAIARDQNPLSRLPGNYRIHEHLKEVVADTETAHTVAYFDFDSFKPFNDAYGFREGDRAIMLFAESLKRKLLDQGAFIGHVGGDDFFVGFRDMDYDAAHVLTMDLIRQFEHDAESLYRPQERKTGYIVAKDREGNVRRFNLMRVSAAVLCLPKGRAPVGIDDVMEALAELKKCAKESPEGLAAACLRTGPTSDGLSRQAAD